MFREHQSREKRRDATSNRSIRSWENARRMPWHSIPSTDRLKSRWNRTLHRARARAMIYKKQIRTRTRTRVFFRRRLAPTLFSRKQRRGRSSWRRLWCQQRRKLRKTFLLSVLRVRVWGFLASGVNFKARFPKKILNTLFDDEKVSRLGWCGWLFSFLCVFGWFWDKKRIEENCQTP